MNTKRRLRFDWTAPLIAALCMAGGARVAPAQTVAPAASVSSDRPLVTVLSVTNWTPRFITNLIEVRMPQNLFVEEYRTNWFPQYITNINWVAQYTTNFIELYQTNRITRAETNEVALVQFETNQVIVHRTNFVTAYQTNVKSLTLTNWETVLVMKTNWIAQPVTNLVEIELPLSATAAPTLATLATTPAPAKPTPTVVAPAPRVEPSPGTSSDAPPDAVLELTRPAATATNNQVEIVMVLKSPHDPTALLPVREWRVERSDYAVLMFGQRPEFKGLLPPGLYKIAAKIQSEESAPVLIARAQIEIALAGGNQKVAATVTPSRR